MSKTILLTGASSGFGLLVANEPHKQGLNGFGTSRNPEKYVSKVPFKMMAPDLDSEESIASFPERLFSEINHLDLLINNSGFWVSGISEETPIKLGRQQFVTNFWEPLK